MSDESQRSGAAADTGNLLAGTPLGALLGGPSGFSINYERVPQAIADLEHAARFFRDRAETASRLARILPPGNDGVSLNAVAQISKWASDTGTNNLEAILKAGAHQLEDLARKLRQDLKTYLQVEELNIPQASPGLTL
ncbi:MAG: hypothetical protein ACRDSH_04275 [Pseudonocardiaceae bacterium]